MKGGLLDRVFYRIRRQRTRRKQKYIILTPSSKLLLLPISETLNVRHRGLAMEDHITRIDTVCAW
jgi:hypothetical protein